MRKREISKVIPRNAADLLYPGDFRHHETAPLFKRKRNRVLISGRYKFDYDVVSIRHSEKENLQ